MLSLVCIDALNNPPSMRQLRTLGVDGVRLVALDDERFDAYVAKLRTASLKVSVVLARESFSTDDYGAEACEYATRVKADLWLLGNEMDAGLLPEPSPSSWKMIPAEYGDFFRRAANGITFAQPDAQLVIGGMVSGQPDAFGDYLATAATRWGGPIHGFDVHPYGKTVPEARDLLCSYRAYAPTLSAYVMEWNRSAKQIPAYVEMLSHYTDGWSWFCAGDWNVPTMGLWNTKGKPKAAYKAYRAALKGA